MHEVIMNLYEVLYQNLPERTDERHEKCQGSQHPGQNLNWEIQKC